MIQPKQMKKISVTGPRSELDEVISRLHSLEVLDIDEYDESHSSFEIGNPGERADRISSVLVDIRSLEDKLPEVEEVSESEAEALEDVEDKIREIKENLKSARESIEELEVERSDMEELLEKIEALKGMGVDPQDLEGHRSLEIKFGKVEDFDFEEKLPEGRYELYRSGDTIALFVDKNIDLEGALRKSGFEPVPLEGIREIDETASEAVSRIEGELDDIEGKIERHKRDIEDLASRNQDYLEENRKNLERELDKAQAPLKFATSENSFVAQGWVPKERFDEIEAEIQNVFDGRVYVSEEHVDIEEEEPPVEHENPPGVASFESLTDLMAVPKYDDIDPSFVIMLTFPLFFGFMIGDAGYGLTTLIVFYLGMKMFPQISDIFKSLMYASVATLIFGLIFGDAFGFIIFGENSALTALTGIEIFSSIPVLFHRAHHLSLVFLLAGIIGFAHVNFGILLGAYREYLNHGLFEAVLEKGGWFVLQAGAFLLYLYGATIGVSVMVAGVVILAIGEGVEGVVEIPSLLSNILSYMRIFGVSVAAISLAQVVNSMASPLFNMGSPVGWIMGTLLLVGGHIFNTFIKIMEGFLQGIRLHYVEMFTKFYEGGGRKYNPFGSN